MIIQSRDVTRRYKYGTDWQINLSLTKFLIECFLIKGFFFFNLTLFKGSCVYDHHYMCRSGRWTKMGPPASICLLLNVKAYSRGKALKKRRTRFIFS